MKTMKTIWGTCLLLFLFQGYLFAQDPVAVCTAKQREVRKLLSQEVLTTQEKTKVYNLVKPCADQGDIDAICHLGILYKDGIGVAQDFDKAFEYFAISAEAGHQKAIYALGYFYLKGLGSITQDYDTAVGLFDESSDPMAIHWLGYCQYFGYGIAKDKTNAVSLLYRNIILNSGTLADQFDAELNPTTGSSSSQYTSLPDALEPIANYTQLVTTLGNAQFLPPAESGSYAGHFVEYDWSGKHVWRYIPFSVEAEVLDNRGNLNILLTVGNDVVQGNARWENGILYFDNLVFDLPRLYTDNPKHTSLKYKLNKITFQPVPHNGTNYLAGVLDATIETWKEPVNPMLVLINQTGSAVDDTIVSELQKQKEIIKVYPNPFQSDFTIGYELQKDALVGITITNTTFSISQEVLSASQKKGFQTLTIPASALPSGMYIVWLWVDGKLDSRTVIKQ